MLFVFQAEKENQSTEVEEKTCTHIKCMQTVSEKAKSVVILCSFNLTRIKECNAEHKYNMSYKTWRAAKLVQS